MQTRTEQIRLLLRRLSATGQLRNEHVLHWAGDWIAGDGRAIDAIRAALAHAQADKLPLHVRDTILAALYDAEADGLIARAAAVTHAVERGN